MSNPESCGAVEHGKLAEGPMEMLKLRAAKPVAAPRKAVSHGIAGDNGAGQHGEGLIGQRRC